MGLQSHFRSANYTAFIRDAIISSKTDLRSGSIKGKRSCGTIRNNKAMSTVLSFIRILYPKQQSNILRCFCSLKFEKKSLFSNKFYISQ